MPELRSDPVTGRQVLIAQDRALRPHHLRAADPGGTTARAEEDCPFCAGREALTPPAVAEILDPAGNWRVRVVPNKYPAIGPPDGAHEVVIESPRHVSDAAELSWAQWTEVLQAYRDRLAAHLQAPGTAYVAVFKNSGAQAGASLEHVHGQVIRLPVAPVGLQAEFDAAAQFYDDRGSCLFCSLLANEISHGARMVAQTERVSAFTAWAGRQPYETWIVPRAHEARFERLDRETAGDLARLMVAVLGRLRELVGQLSYNLVLHTAPKDNRWDAAYHWHWELIPRTSPMAGLELGGGMFINTLPPEEAARQLRAGEIGTVGR